MEAKVKQSILSPRQVELGYRITRQAPLLLLWYGEELVSFCALGAIPGVLREVAWRHSWFTNLTKIEGGNKCP